MSSAIRLLLTRILAETRAGPEELSSIRKGLKITDETVSSLVAQLKEAGTITVNGGTVTLTLRQRLDAALAALRSGADIEAVSRALTWQEFEELSAKVFEENGFGVRRRFRFTAEGRRWEIDFLASHHPYLLLTECKRWEKGMGNQTARGIVEGHLEKAEVFSRHALEFRARAGLEKVRRATVVPLIVTLSATPLDVYRRVPAVSVLTLPRFLDEFAGQLGRIAHSTLELPEYIPEAKKTRKRQKAG